MTRLFLLAALAVLLPACDSGESTDPDALVGTWRTQSVTDTYYVTSTVAQTGRDPLTAGTGAVVLSGALTATLRFAPLNSAGAAVTGGFVCENATLSPTFSQTCIAFGETGAPSITRNATSYVPVAGAAPYTFTPTAISFAETGFRVAGGNGPAVLTATGRLEFVRRPLVAGQESIAAQEVVPLASFPTASITFDADGSYRRLTEDGPETGTWVVSGEGEVTLRTATFSISYRYALRGRDLTLTAIPLDQTLTAADRQRYEALLGMTAGTLTTFRKAVDVVYGRTAE